MLDSFPLDLPGPTRLYLLLYVFTFAVHQLFMHYVAAGSLLLSIDALRGQLGSTNDGSKPGNSSIEQIVRDWLPFQLSAAITAGVAPLLFVQILYPKQFYTANLLLGWRWMIVVPILILAFYGLYLLKSNWLLRANRSLRIFVAASLSIAFLFVGFCWTVNHTIANSESDWTTIYRTTEIPIQSGYLISRMAIWIGGSFATLACLLDWQFGRVVVTDIRKRLAWLAICGLCVCSLAALCHYRLSHQAAQQAIQDQGRAFAIFAAFGALLQVAGWILALRQPAQGKLIRAFATAGLIVLLLAMSMLRELVRFSTVRCDELFEAHATSAQVEGLWLFLLGMVANGIAIAYCVLLCRRGIERG